MLTGREYQIREKYSIHVAGEDILEIMQHGKMKRIT